ncbi:hypothetical protein EHH60_24075, partial [Bradyrhizobium sp. RP6]
MRQVWATGPRLDARVAASGRRRQVPVGSSVWSSERAWHPGDQPAARQACCPERALPLEQAWLSEQVWRSEQVLPVVPPVRRAQESASRWAPAQAGPEELLRAAGPVASEPGGHLMVPEAACAAVRREAASARVAAESPREAVLAAWEPGARQAAPEEAVSGRA